MKRLLLSALLSQPAVKRLLSAEHFSIDGAMLGVCLDKELPGQGRFG
ncbi:hypothetical protein JOH51_000990 [Rhizobium leguminosarum]|nr:hypothetical protein [Rhizobium leguminosarum]